ncbi:hypothetical protein K2X05_11645 [bacterium]|nr:hypothetical protein [bacterium]
MINRQNRTLVKKGKPATQVFTSCPACRDEQLIEVDSDLVCSSCDWNSCLYSVESGQMDNFMENARRLEEPARIYVRPVKSRHENWDEKESQDASAEWLKNTTECA